MKTMSTFIDYIETQIAVMRKDIGDIDDGKDEYGNKKIVEWINTHASDFREQWEKNRVGRKKHHAVE